jgi:hypothetical protein
MCCKNGKLNEVGVELVRKRMLRKQGKGSEEEFETGNLEICYMRMGSGPM